MPRAVNFGRAPPASSPFSPPEISTPPGVKLRTGEDEKLVGATRYEADGARNGGCER